MKCPSKSTHRGTNPLSNFRNNKRTKGVVSKESAVSLSMGTWNKKTWCKNELIGAKTTNRGVARIFRRAVTLCHTRRVLTTLSSTLRTYNYLELEIGCAMQVDSSNSCVAYDLYVCKIAKLLFRAFTLRQCESRGARNSNLVIFWLWLFDPNQLVWNQAFVYEILNLIQALTLMIQIGSHPRT